MRKFGWVALGLLASCTTVPREVETVLHLGAERVDIDVQLKDIRTTANERDGLNQLRLFGTVSAWKPEWTDTMPWAPTPDVYRFSADAGRLDLTMHASMKRADFDRCARGAVFDGGPSVCNGFPLELNAKGYSAAPFIETMKLKVPSSVKTQWATNAPVISFTTVVTPEIERGAEGPSFAKGYQLFSADPAVAAATITQIDLAEKQFTTAPAAVWVKTAAEVYSCGSTVWCQYRLEAVRRSQANLLYRYLQRGKETSLGLKPPPEQLDALQFNLDTLSKVLPTDAFSPIDALRLRLYYDNGLDEYRGRGELGWGTSLWSTVCRAEVTKKQSLKEMCMRLGAMK